MNDFLFDENLTPEQNIDSFFQYLSAKDQKMANLLRDNLQTILPLPEPGGERNEKRRIFNTKIAQALDEDIEQ